MIVLSNGDGCVISLSNESKSLGISMGAPFFKIKDLVERKGVAVLSSNYTLYGDFSKRLMSTLQLLFPQVEVYSIDEAFLFLAGMEKIENYAKEAREVVHQWLGLPISIGIGPTKTLAKAANKLAKDRRLGVFVLQTPEQIAEELASFPVENIWGVGKQLTKSLHCQGIFTALDFPWVGYIPSPFRRNCFS